MANLSGLGVKDRELLSAVLRETKGTIMVRDAARALRRSDSSTAKWLSRWAKKGWLSRVRRGLYIRVPLEAISPDVTPEDPWIIIDRLYSPCYIGGWSAAAYWELTEQIFRTVVVITARRVRELSPQIRGTPLLIRTTTADRLFGTKAIWRAQAKVSVSDPARTIVDILDRPDLGGGIRTTADILTTYLSSDKKDLDLLVSYATRLRNGAVFKRLGFLLERIAPGEVKAIGECKASLTKGKVKLDPALKADRLVTRWQLWVPESWAKRE